MKVNTEFAMAAVRTVAAIVITYLWLTVPKPIALIIPGDVQIPQVLNNFSYMQYNDQENEKHGPVEMEVQVTGGSMSRLGRNLYQENRDRYYIITRLCNAEALMDFATIRSYESNWIEIEFDNQHETCEVVDISWMIPYDYDPKAP